MKMKKKILSAAVLAALGASTAQAVNVGTDGTGQVLLFPYYTVQGGEKTNLSVVNTTDYGKAVKIRFREAYDSREVLDFNIYLSPYDVWTGTVQESTTGSGAAQVTTNDMTCTVPTLYGNPQDFRTYEFDGVTKPNDNGPSDNSRTREGYVEIIEMGVADLVTMPGALVWDQNGNGIPDYLHSNSVPDNCAGLIAAWGAQWNTAPNTGLLPPMGGIFGALGILNVATGTEIAVAAVGLEDVFTTPQHNDTGTLAPTLAQADPESVVMLNDGGPLGQDVTVYADTWGFGPTINGVSAVLMADSVMNQWSVNPAVDANTGWVVTFPTKWAHTDPLVVGAVATPPFTDVFGSNDLFPAGDACEEVGVIVYDREENSVVPSGLDFSPTPVAPGVYLCYEANMVQFGGSDTLSAQNTVLTYTNLPGNNGWMNLSMTADPLHAMVADSGNVYVGLPVVGFRATVLGNANVGVGASYAYSTDHSYHRTISGTGTPF